MAEKKYELCVRDTHQVIKNTLSTADFEKEFDTQPYRQFHSNADRIYSNLLLGDWAWQEADNIAKDVQDSAGAMLVPIILGLDKTTVSKKKEYQRFVRQLYHTCLARIFEPLRAGMSTPEVVRCPDGHFCHAVYSIGPVIADYPEQVWLSGIVQGWCPKCTARPHDLDNPHARRRTHDKTDTLIQVYDASILWTEHGIRDNIVVKRFPCADIHELMAPDLLHQVIKGAFKDHLVTWVMEYIEHTHGKAKALEIIADINHRALTFKEGRNFLQWTGDDSKALMKVYLAAIVGYVPDEMVQCIASFLELCYIFRQNTISTTALRLATLELAKFHQLREFFVETGMRSSCSLPRQHGLKHFLTSIPLFGSPNGLCSSITESRHITAVKEPWWQSSRYNALSQMLTIITRLDRLSAFRPMHTALVIGEMVNIQDISSSSGSTYADDDLDTGPEGGPWLASSIRLAADHVQASFFFEYLYSACHPSRLLPPDIHLFMAFTGRIHVYHTAVAHFYAASDACGVGGMQRQIIRCNPCWHNQTCMVGEVGVIATFEGRSINVSRQISRAIHDIPGKLPEDFSYIDSLEAFGCYFVNSYIDNHAHEI
ncbi:hypothetical protein BKA70DRAFT_1379649 [Coprinopsis sp. MPI-PUGE-AT-0042]|nr:hypothetical protein BKA70DRAFT_1379649 [Coprinopsis sp. MPI-PUGE-AT-0042]